MAEIDLYMAGTFSFVQLIRDMYLLLAVEELVVVYFGLNPLVAAVVAAG